MSVHQIRKPTELSNPIQQIPIQLLSFVLYSSLTNPNNTIIEPPPPKVHVYLPIISTLYAFYNSRGY